jgi:CRP-like cAMP-binding protein
MDRRPNERNAFLAALSAADFALLRSHLASFDLRVGDVLHSFGDRIDDVIFPHSGLVAAAIPLPEGARAATILSGRDSVVGGFAAAAGVPAAGDAEVHISGQASRMSAAAFRYLLDHNSSIRRVAALFDAAEMAQAHCTAVCNAVHPVDARFCRWLLDIHDRSDGGSVPLTQSTLAHMLGVRRTTITLVAGRLEAAGALNCRRGYVSVARREELERRSCHCYLHLKGYVAQLFASPKEDAPAADAYSSSDVRIAAQTPVRK